jgi:hypothetical protein
VVKLVKLEIGKPRPHRRISQSLHGREGASAARSSQCLRTCRQNLADQRLLVRRAPDKSARVDQKRRVGMKLLKATGFAAALVAVVLSSALASFAQDWPSKPVKIGLLRAPSDAVALPAVSRIAKAQAYPNISLNQRRGPNRYERAPSS